jgi:glycosyltransferase A (GT-A) superfamily protein (DUF2064 family)
MSRPTLILFLRVPRVGRGKSRLARDVGKVEALRLSRWLTARALRRVRDLRWDVVVRVTPDSAVAAPWGHTPPAPTVSAKSTGLAGGVCPRMEPQGWGDLGERLQRAIRAHGRGPVAVVGTDIPDLSTAHIARAFNAARRSGAAIGPAADGGFWILALSARRARTIALGGVRWSSEHALADTVAALGGDVERLETLIDIDDARSLAAWQIRGALGRRTRVQSAAS